MNVPGELISVFTFGSPRVGNSYFSRAYDDMIPTTFRVVNCKDIVTKVRDRPPELSKLSAKKINYDCFLLT